MQSCLAYRIPDVKGFGVKGFWRKGFGLHKACHCWYNDFYYESTWMSCKRERPGTTGSGGDREPHDRVLKGTKTAREENETKMQEKNIPQKFFPKGSLQK